MIIRLLALALMGLSSFGQPLTDKQILERVYQTYRTARSYQDEGIVTTTFISKPQNRKYDGLYANTVERFLDFVRSPHTDVLHFQTAYLRSTGQFRFAYQKQVSVPPKQACTVASNGTITQSWKSFLPRSSQGYIEPTLTNALAELTGVSSTASRKIPGLLLAQPIEAGWDIRQVNNWQRMPNAIHNGRLHYRFTAPVSKHGRATLYIDPKTGLIGRIDEEMEGSSLKVTTKMEYKPVVNQRIPDSMVAMDAAY